MTPVTPPDPAPPAAAEAASSEATFGPRAQALEARALLAGRTPRGWDAQAVDVAYRRGALPPESRALLAKLATARLSTPPAAAGGEGWERLRCALAELMAVATEDPVGLRCLLAAHRHAHTAPAPPRIMGIVNVTPDSFSDGGRCLDPERAVAHGLSLLEDGADLLDVGGESTRPGSEGVSIEEELRRVVPVVEGLRARTTAPISIDTTKEPVARAALDAGADIVNDVSAGRFDERLLELVAARGCPIVLMHMRGRPRDMQADPRYVHVVAEVVDHLRRRTAACLKTGIAATKITLDPGIGFGKDLGDNLALIRGLPELRSLGRPILLGVSRKSFLGLLSGTEDAAARTMDTAAAVAAGVLYGAEVLRVHDVRSTLPAVRVAAALAAERDDLLPQRRA